MSPTEPSVPTTDLSSSRDTLIADRVRAIRTSGWGASFRFVQPRNLAFWVYLVLVTYGVVIMVRYFGNATAVYGAAIEMAVVLFGLYAALFWWFTQRIDRYAHQSRRLIVLAFLWGGFGAIFMASNANTPILSIWAKAFGTSWSSDWGAGLTAPYIEELSKGLGLLLLIALARRAVATAFDGFILGAFIGLGFQIVEDVTYAVGSAGQGFGANPVGNLFQLLVMRMSLGVGAHIAYSAVFCAGLVYFLGRPAQPRRRGLGIVLMLTAMILHGIWDDLGGILGTVPTLLVAGWVIMTAIVITIAVLVFKQTVQPERDYMRQVLAPEVAAGTVTGEEAETLAGDRKARRRYRKVKADRQRRRYTLQAAHDLADELARAGGQDTPRVEFARQEVDRIRQAAPPMV